MLRLLSILSLLLLAACGLPRNVVVLMPDDTGTVGKADVTSAGATVTLDSGLAAVGTKPGAAPGEVFTAKAEDVSDAFAGALAATPRKPVSYIIYFLNRQTVPETSSRADLDAAVAAAKSMPNVDISVSGHADATGSDAENLNLSLRRAETVRDALVAGGVAADAIEITYHGANNPLVPSRPGVPEPRNRRVEVTIR
jgi:outer membrane protein OmpA-like peptidoglycan-associated protein